MSIFQQNAKNLKLIFDQNNKKKNRRFDFEINKSFEV